MREGRVSIEPLRYLKQFAMAFNGTFIDLASVIMLITQHFRPAKVSELQDRYKREWRAMLLHHANVSVEPVSVGH